MKEEEDELSSKSAWGKKQEQFSSWEHFLCQKLFQKNFTGFTFELIVLIYSDEIKLKKIEDNKNIDHPSDD